MATQRGDLRANASRAALAVLAALTAAVPSSGQIYFGISPIRAEHRIMPGESLTEVFEIRNNAAGPIRLKVYVENWTILSDGTPSFIGSTPTTYSCKDWIIVNPQNFRLAAGETRSVRYTITVPADTSAAGYHASVSFETVADAAGDQAANRMLFTGKIAAVVYVVAGRPAVEGDLLDLTLGTRDGAQAVVLALENTGRTHFRTKGKILVYDAADNRIADVPLPDDILLPESKKNVACALPKALEPGTYRVVCILDIGRPELIEMERSLEVVK
jgi:hypothetical protein